MAPADHEQDILDTEAAGPAAVRGAAARVAAYGAGAVLSVVGAAFLFRALGVRDAGRYVTVLSIVTIAGTLTDAGLAALGVRELTTRPAHERDAFLGNLLGIRLALAVAGVLAALAFTWIADYPDVMLAAVALAGVALVLQAAQTTLAVPLTAHLRLIPVAWLEVLRQGVQAGFVVLFAIVGAGLLAFVGAAVPAALAALVATVVLVSGLGPSRPRVKLGEWRTVLVASVPFAAATVSAALYFRSSIVIVSLTTGARQTGLFGVSFRVIEVLVIIPQLLVGSAFPILSRAARDDRARFAYGLGRSFDVAFLLGAGTAMLLAVGAPLVIRVIAGPDFAAAEPVLRVQALALSASFVAAVGGAALLSLRRHRAVVVVTLVGLVVTAALVVVLSHRSGAHGAAWGTVVGEFLIAIGFAVALVRGGVRPGVRVAAIPRVLLACGLGVLPLLLPWPNVVQTALAAVLFGGTVLLLRAVPDEVTAHLPRWAVR